jgi:two-component system chemotaxis response regulator CheY
MDHRAPIRVLVVDDDPQLQDLLKYALEAFGLTVVGTADNGSQALMMFQKIRPDAVVLDMRMPIMDGITALRKLKEIDPNCIALMITASHEDEDRRVALELGAVGFLYKPFRVDELFRDIQKSFRNLLARRSEAPLDEQYVKYVLGRDIPRENSGPHPRPAPPQTAVTKPPPDPTAVTAAGGAPAAEPAPPAPPPPAEPPPDIEALKAENERLRAQLKSAQESCLELARALDGLRERLR